MAGVGHAWHGGMHGWEGAWQGGMCGRGGMHGTGVCVEGGHAWHRGVCDRRACMAGGVHDMPPWQILRDTVNEWVVRIILECILVPSNIHTGCCSYFMTPKWKKYFCNLLFKPNPCFDATKFAQKMKTKF